MLHCEETQGESNVAVFAYNLVDEAGNRYVDEAGNAYITYDTAVAQILHAPLTDTMLHCEAT